MSRLGPKGLFEADRHLDGYPGFAADLVIHGMPRDTQHLRPFRYGKSQW